MTSPGPVKTPEPRRRHRRRAASAAVELAVLLPLLVFLFIIATDFCRVYYCSQTVQNCAYSGALYASSTAERTPGISAETAAKTAAVAEGTTLKPVLASSQVTYTPADANGNIQVSAKRSAIRLQSICQIPMAFCSP
jgi:Flp pilus assembly protein TadG